MSVIKYSSLKKCCWLKLKQLLRLLLHFNHTNEGFKITYPYSLSFRATSFSMDVSNGSLRSCPRSFWGQFWRLELSGLALVQRRALRASDVTPTCVKRRTQSTTAQWHKNESLKLSPSTWTLGVTVFKLFLLHRHLKAARIDPTERNTWSVLQFLEFIVKWDF